MKATILALLLLLVGCADHDNPRGPRRHPEWHYPSCRKRCTGFMNLTPHERRP